MVLAAAMFLLLLGRRQFAASHEARVAQVAREMAAAGWPWDAAKVDVARVRPVKRAGMLRLAPEPDAPLIRVNPWVVPILNGEVRLQKPPLPYWCAAVLFRLVGVNEGTARFVPAVLGALTTFLLFDLALLLYGRRVAWCAALVWVTTYIIPEEYRVAMADPYLAFFTLACVWAWVRASGRTTRRRGDAETRREDTGVCFPFSASPRLRVPASSPARAPARRDLRCASTLNPYLLLFYASLAMGALSKGPPILLHVAVPIVMYHICFRARLPGGWTGHLLGAAAFLAIALPWPLLVLRQVPNATVLWRYESVGEISGENQENLREWWYYLANLPLLAAPWLALWVFSVVFPFLRNRSRVFFPFAWYALILVFFTLVGQKKDPYLLPMMPAQAMMIAVAAVPLLCVARRIRMRRLPGAVVAVQAAIGVGFALALPVLVWQDHAARAAGLFVSAGAIGLSLLPVREMFSARSMRWLDWQGVAYAAILLAFCNFYLTPVNNDRSPVALCRELRSLADGTHRVILGSKLPEEAAFYLPLHPKEGTAPMRYLVVVDDQVGVQARAKKGRAEPPAESDKFDGWVPDAKVVSVRRVKMNSAPGDARWKVYELTVDRSALALK